MWIRLACVLLLLFMTTASAARKPTVVFMSDFGVVDDSVAICKGVMLRIEPDLEIIDLTHQVTPFSILDGARFLAGASPYYPPGTVFLVVIDPGVGSTRMPVIAKTKRGQYFVVPDNGVITLVLQRDGLEGAREITNPDWMLPTVSSETFHGRDIFSPAAGHLASGKDWRKAGPEIKDLVRLHLDAPKRDDQGVSGEVIALDGPFGNCITNIRQDDLRTLDFEWGETVRLRLGDRELTIPFVKTFSDVPLNQPLLYIDSRGNLSLALNQGNFAATYGIHPPLPILIYRK